MLDEFGKLILRLALALLMLFHGFAKLRYGVGFIEGTLQSHGLPGFFAYGVFVGEVLAPLMVLAGFYARAGAALIAINMVFAVALVHASELAAIAKSGGWALELQALFFFTAVAIALLGPGKFGVNRS
ncbi:MAG: DoxX family protein [Burkholderiales bacterium]|nr:DoxX family protein [Burkholderiales bacterium]